MNIWAEKVESQLISLGSFLKNSDWYGRENELVNLFVHSFLSASIKIAQIGIEVAVKQLPRVGGKALVRKDLVVWNSPNETVWANGEPANDPAVIVEFKVNAADRCARDLDWLGCYTKVYPRVVGFAVCGYIKHNRCVTYSRVEKGEIAAQQIAPADTGLVA